MGYFIHTKTNIKIYVEDLNPIGEKTILFIHGWPGNHKLFEYQFNFLPAVGFRCIGMDIRGFGKSDKPWSGYDYDTLADDVKDIIDSLGLNNITLAGHSTGGAIALRYMSRYHGFGVSKLALFAAAAPSLIQRPDFPYGLERETVEQLIEGTYNDRPKMLSDFGDIFFFQHITSSFADWIFQLGLQAAGYSTEAIANTWLNEVLFSDMEAIHVPTLIIHGIHDKVVPFSLGEIQNKGIKNSTLIPFYYSGHGAFYDEKDRFNEELTRFIMES